MPLAVVKLAEEYLANGGTLIGERPLRSQGNVLAKELRQFETIVNSLWTDCESSAENIAVGKGQLFCMASARRAECDGDSA